MPRRNRDERRTQQHAKGKARPRGWHRKARSEGMKRAVDWLDQQQRKAA